VTEALLSVATSSAWRQNRANIKRAGDGIVVFGLVRLAILQWLCGEHIAEDQTFLSMGIERLLALSRPVLRRRKASLAANVILVTVVAFEGVYSGLITSAQVRF
jgi:hypothetical protein